jgi:magnesium transporter
MLVNCVAYERGRKLADIALGDVAAYLARPDCFVWVALADPTEAELASMQQQFGLHELAVEDALSGHQRPKVEEYGETIFVVMHTVEIDGHDLHQGEVDVFANPKFVLSLRNRTRRGFADVRARCESEPELLQQGAGFVLYALMDAIVDRYFPVIDMLETELESLESQMFEGGLARRSLREIYALKRKLTVLQHAVGPLLDAVGRLYGGRVPRVCGHSQEYFRDVLDHLLRINQTIGASRETISMAVQSSLSLISLQESELTKRLAAIAALVAVPTMIAGIYGMNFEHMPELRWKYGYPMALGAMILIDVYLFYRLRKARWL